MSTSKYQSIRDLTLVIRDGFISLLAAISFVFLLISIYQASTNPSIIFEPIAVPNQLNDLGYNPEITTARIVDEVKKINLIANTTKRRNAHTHKQLGGDLSNLTSGTLPANIDVKAIQVFIGDVLGIKKRTISGDITLSSSGKKQAYQVRIRLSPDDVILVDQEFTGSIESVLQEVSLRLIERIDPVVAASYYRVKGQTVDTLRMVDIAQNSDNLEDKTWGLTQRVYILIAQKRLDLARADLDQVFKYDPQSPNGWGMLSYVLYEQGKYEESIQAANTQIKYSPDLAHGYLNKARAEKALGIDDEEAYRTALGKNKLRPNHLITIGKYFETKNQLDLARKAFLKAAVEYPENQHTNFHHAQRLLKDGHIELAHFYVSRAIAIEPTNTKFLDLLKQTDIKNTTLK